MGAIQLQELSTRKVQASPSKPPVVPSCLVVKLFRPRKRLISWFWTLIVEGKCRRTLRSRVDVYKTVPISTRPHIWGSRFDLVVKAPGSKASDGEF